MKNSMEVPLKLEFPYDAAIPFLGIYLEKMLFQKDPNNHVFTEVLFTIAKTWKQPNCPLTDECIKKMCLYILYMCISYIYTQIEYYLSIKKNEIMLLTVA